MFPLPCTTIFMNPISKILLTLSVSIVLFAGVLPSIISNDWMWFSRSGALLTAYAVAITFLDFTGFIDNSFADISARIDKILEVRGLSKVRQEKSKEIEQQKKHIFNEMTLSFKRVEFWSLVLGTIIWGYGDLLGPAAPPCGC